jgi:hypothetical protein
LMGLTLLAFPAVPCAHIAEVGEVSVQPTPEIKKLFEAFAGDWDTGEKRERTQFSRTEASAKEDRTYGGEPAAPCW